MHEKRHSEERHNPNDRGGRITSSLEALVRIAETFNVSVDYLVVPDGSHRPLHSPENLLGDKLAGLATVDEDDQAALLQVLDTFVTKTTLRALTGGAS